MNPHRPRPGTHREVARWTWYVLRIIGRLPRDLWRPMLREACRYAWDLALEQVRWEHIVSGNAMRARKRMDMVHRMLRTLVVKAPDGNAPFAVPGFRYWYVDRYGRRCFMWRR
jgi:hypothetical protein